MRVEPDRRRALERLATDCDYSTYQRRVGGVAEPARSKFRGEIIALLAGDNDEGWAPGQVAPERRNQFLAELLIEAGREAEAYGLVRGVKSEAELEAAKVVAKYYLHRAVDCAAATGCAQLALLAHRLVHDPGPPYDFLRQALAAPPGETSEDALARAVELLADLALLHARAAGRENSVARAEAAAYYLSVIGEVDRLRLGPPRLTVALERARQEAPGSPLEAALGRAGLAEGAGGRAGDHHAGR